MDVQEQVLSATRTYYDAFGRCDLPAAMACWARRDDISCVAPLFDPAFGPQGVEDLYRSVFGIIAAEVFEYEILDTTTEDPLAVVTCAERVTNVLEGHTSDFLASNLLVLDGTGWRLLHRHVSWRAAREVFLAPR